MRGGSYGTRSGFTPKSTYRIIWDYPALDLVAGKVWATAPQFCGLKFAWRQDAWEFPALPARPSQNQRNLPASLPVVRATCHQSATRISARRRTEILGETGSPLAGVRRLLANGKAWRQMPLQTNCEKRAWRHCRQLRRSRQASPAEFCRMPEPNAEDRNGHGSCLREIVRPQNCGADAQTLPATGSSTE